MTKPKLTDAEILAAVPEALRAQVASDLNMVRLQAQAMDQIIAAFKRQTTREIDATCPLCGTRTIYHTRDASAPAAVMAVCSKCSEG